MYRTSGERQEVGGKGNKAIGKKIYKFKKLTLYRETKQNYSNQKKTKRKGRKEKKEEKKKNSIRPESNSGPCNRRVDSLHAPHQVETYYKDRDNILFKAFLLKLPRGGRAPCIKLIEP